MTDPANLRRAVLLLTGLFALGVPFANAMADPTNERAEMVETIRSYERYAEIFAGKEHFSPQVLEVIGHVERHRFVPDDQRALAYADMPLPIGYGQTISQPLIVAYMTHLLEPEAGDVVLEIGTGSGYQAAVLSPLVARVCTIEIIEPLGLAAAERRGALGYGNVDVKIADGYHGWPECGPFDGIVVTAATDHVPPPLVDQLKPSGRMVIPVGGRFSTQYLTVVEKSETGEVSTSQHLAVRFVPFTRAAQ